MLEIRHLNCGYETHEVLHDVNMTIPEGKLFILLGPNGAGKTTLLKTIDGLLKPKSGEIVLNGEDLRAMDAKERARHIAYLLQNRNIPSITAERLVMHGRFPYLSFPRRYSSDDRKIVAEALRKADASDLSSKNVMNLSGGERQKVYLAMALAQDTGYILMDEPTAFLDIAHQLDVMEMAKKLTKEGKTIVMVLHDLRLAMQYADLISVCHDGTAEDPKTPEELADSEIWNEVFKVSLQRIETESGMQYWPGR